MPARHGPDTPAPCTVQAAGSKEALLEHMRMVGKLDGLKEQQTLQKQMQLAAQLGDNEKVRQLQARLAPDDPRKSAASKNYGARPPRQRRGACSHAR